MAFSVGLLFTANAQKGNTTVQKSNNEKSGVHVQVESVETPPHYSTKISYLTQDFEGVTFPPAGWTTVSGTNSTVTTADEEWHRTTNGNPGGAAFVTYVSSVRYHDEYLISPEVTLPNSACRIGFDFNSSIYWHAQTLGGTYDNVDLKLLISTNSGASWDDIIWQEDQLLY